MPGSKKKASRGNKSSKVLLKKLKNKLKSLKKSFKKMSKRKH